MKSLLVNSDGAKDISTFNSVKESQLPLEMTLRQIFKDKAPQYTEIEVSFFQLCNLHCRFCWQDNYDETGVTSIAEKSEVAIEFLQKEKERLHENIQVHMLGGELFEDSNNYYDQYYEFIMNIYEYVEKELPEKNLLFVFLTNMNFQNIETRNRLENFLNLLKEKGIKFILTTSWDPTGRPLAGEVSTKFHENITYFKEYLAEITFVLTKQTIKRLLKDKNHYLDLLVEEGFKIDFDYYMPTTQVDSTMPSDWDLLNAFRYLIKRYPHISKLKAWTQNINAPTKITCASLSKITILPDSTVTNCRHLNYDQKDFDTDIINESNASMIMNFLTTKECLSCPHFIRCPLSCFLMADHKKYLGQKQLDTCFYRTLFDENKASK